MCRRFWRERESRLGSYYDSRENWSAAIARLQTVADTYPLYTKSDQACSASATPTPARRSDVQHG